VNADCQVSIVERAVRHVGFEEMPLIESSDANQRTLGPWGLHTSSFGGKRRAMKGRNMHPPALRPVVAHESPVTSQVAKIVVAWCIRGCEIWSVVSLSFWSVMVGNIELALARRRRNPDFGGH
jgi:hypothetical protein